MHNIKSQPAYIAFTFTHQNSGSFVIEEKILIFYFLLLKTLNLVRIRLLQKNVTNLVQMDARSHKTNQEKKREQQATLAAKEISFKRTIAVNMRF